MLATFPPKSWMLSLAGVGLLAVSSGCDDSEHRPTPTQASGQTKAEAIAQVPAVDPAKTAQARAFIADVDKELRRLGEIEARASWAKQTDITDEHEKAAAEATAAMMAYTTQAIQGSTAFNTAEADPETARQLKLLKLSRSLPAPKDPALRDELAAIEAKLDGIYGKGKYCKNPKKPKTCRDLGELSDVLASSRNYDELLEAWKGWRTISVPMRPMYQRFVELGNTGAREIGFADMGELWRSGYDMSPAAFEQEMERLWQQVKPLYEQLHCHVRARLHEQYGDKVPQTGPIPAHVLGNMWSQSWGNLYPMLEPYKGEPSIDVSKALVAKGYDELQMVRLGESFFTSMGLPKLPETFWQRSMFTKPDDREVVCHASAWDVTNNNDLRIKMCIKINHEDLVTIHHELGHNYYYNSYYTLPVLFQGAAHDGFHEGIGDAIALSITPSYLKQVGLLDEVSNSDKAVINSQMQTALEKIAFLPFGKLIDQWRWDVFAGKAGPSAYNRRWWQLRQQYQGIVPPEPRGEDLFDPGAKYHIPGNTPYARYFLAHILQFQFHKAMCEAAGFKGPLHECSVYGSKEAGAKLRAMLAMGQSQPWPDALEKLTGTRAMDAGPLLEYFAPLRAYLEEQNQGRTCGW